MTPTWNRISEVARLASDQRVLDMSPSHAVRAQQHQGLAHERWQVNALLVGNKVQLVEDRVVLGQVLVLEGLLLAREDATVGDDVLVLGVLDGVVGRAPLLQLGAGYEASGGACRG